MDPVPYTRVRNELARLLDQVNDDRAPVLITRRRGKPAVLMSAEEYSALAETAHIMSSPANVKRLREAHEEIEKEIARVARRRRRRR